MKLFIGLALSCLLAVPAWSAPTTAPASPDQHLELEISDGVSPQHSRRYYYNFGSVRVNWSEWAYITLRNTGYSPVQIYGISVYGSGFSGWTGCPYYLRGGETCTTRVEFRPWHQGYYSGRLDFRLSSGNIYFDLSGWGVW